MAVPANANPRTQFIRFIIVGLVNTAVGFAIYALLVRFLAVPPQPALAIAFVLGVIWNYFTHAKFVFATNGLKRILPYAAAYLIVYGFNALALRWLLDQGVGAVTSQAILAPIAAVLSFLLIGKALTGRFPLAGPRA